MTPDQLKQAHRRYIDSLNSHSAEHIDALFHDNYIVHEGFNGKGGEEYTYPVSLDMLRQAVTQPIPGLPDKQLDIRMQIAEGDKCFTYCVATATHSGKWLKFRATNKKLTYENLFISRFWDGKIAEHWIVLDAFGMLRQIGAV